MGALQSKRNRSIDSVWTSNKDIIAVLEAMMGVSIGTDNGPLFIQDAGQKLKDRVYVDKNTGKMYSCVTDNTSIVNDINFIEMSISNSHDKLFNISKVFPVSNVALYKTYDVRYVFLDNIILITGYINASNNTGGIAAGTLGSLLELPKPRPMAYAGEVTFTDTATSNVYYGKVDGRDLVLESNIPSGAITVSAAFAL